MHERKFEPPAGPRGLPPIHMLKALSAGMVLWLCLAVAPSARAAGDWFTSLYAGAYTDTTLLQALRFKTDFEDSYVYVLSLGKEVGRWKDIIGVELEGQLGVHSGLQTHPEINGVFTLRWLPFPWDRWLDTSLAFGNGASYAFEDPYLEIRESDEQQTAKWLYYILVELAFEVPRRHDWDVFVRVHHRSSVFGLIDGLYTGSNFVGLGIRYRF